MMADAMIGGIQPNGLTHGGHVHVSSEGAGGSPEASSTASDSPTPTNSVHEKNWSSHWQGLVCEEHRQLLGTEEESSDRHSSDGEPEPDDAEVWTMTEEQLEYYRAQFCSLQPDPTSLLPGQIARKFFEKSRLPVQELRKIWQLSDVTKDGALSLAEFNTAMHLVVLRRNNIQLPDTLPPSLVPPVTVQRPHESSPQLGNNSVVLPSVTGTSTGTVVPVGTGNSNSTAVTQPSPTPSTNESGSPHRGKEWTKFFDSPTSSVSSPGPKPVNFDFHKSAVEQDPKILHPVPVRVTPGPDVLDGSQEEPKRLTEQLSGSGGDASPIRPIQRPQPKKTPAPCPGAIPPPPQPVLEEANLGNSGPTSLPVSSVSSVIKKDPPPPPPPRPYRTHARSSSLDLNKLGKSGGFMNAPPVVPPRISPGTLGQRSGDGEPNAGFADFAQFAVECSSNAEHPRTRGAFHIYRKPGAEVSERMSPSRELPVLPAEPSVGMRMEYNNVLLQLRVDLQQDLVQIKKEKIVLTNLVQRLKTQQQPPQ